MSFCSARVAPEKAVFRPALPLHSQPEFTGERSMATRKSYAEQLKHPNWQRKRLEVLQAADFQCELCGDKETTLHVHHKRYVKGREVWEYEARELQCLCEACHAEHHELHGLLEEVLASADYFDPYRTVLALAVGYMEACYAIDVELSKRVRAKVGRSADIGILALALGTASRERVLKFLQELIDGGLTDPVTEGLLARLSEEDGAD
jgi:5-methylcytosine-specific restriction endonuclease McrA